MTKLLHEPLKAKCYMDINNNNELHTHQGMRIQYTCEKVSCSDTLYSL